MNGTGLDSSSASSRTTVSMAGLGSRPTARSFGATSLATARVTTPLPQPTSRPPLAGRYRDQVQVGGPCRDLILDTGTPLQPNADFASTLDVNSCDALPHVETAIRRLGAVSSCVGGMQPTIRGRKR